MHPPRPIEDFVDILRVLVDAGVSFAVIGGCAVGCYARMLGSTVLSGDLDICVTEAALQDVLVLAEREGAKVVSRPQPRGVPVAFVEWHGLELNALTGATQTLPRGTAGDEAAGGASARCGTAGRAR